jgi:hypothetical protein
MDSPGGPLASTDPPSTTSTSAPSMPKQVVFRTLLSLPCHVPHQALYPWLS